MTLGELHNLSAEEAYFIGLQEGKNQFDIEAYKVGWINACEKVEGSLLDSITSKCNQAKIKSTIATIKDRITVKRRKE